MNKRALCLTLSILLGVSTLASSGPLHEAPASVEGAAAAAPLAAQSAISNIETGNAAVLSAMTSDADTTVSFIRAAASNPDLLSDAGVRADAERVLGAAGVSRLQAAAAALRAQNDPAIKSVLASWRRQSAAVTPAKAQLALTQALRATAGWSKTSETDGSAAIGQGRSAAPLAKSTRRFSLRSAAAGALMAAGVLGVAAPAHSQLLAPASIERTAPAHLVRVAATDEQPSKVAAADVNEMLQNFEPSAQVYLVGNPRVTAAVINGILAEIKGKPYVVVIVNNADADANVYKDISGNVHQGMDAVDFAVNEGLYSRGGVTEKKGVTGDREGAIFTIAFAKQGGKMFFRGSDEMRSHGIAVLKKDARPGDRVFPGDLDQWAKQKLGAGRDIAGAVHETFANIQGLLDQKINAELNNGQSAIDAAKAAADSLSDKQKDFKSRHAAAASAGIGGADVAAMHRSISQAETLLSSHKVKEAAQAVAGIAAKAQQAVSAMASFDASFNDASNRLAEARASIDALDKAAVAFRSSHKDAAGDLARPKVGEMRETLKSAETQINTKPDAALPEIRRAKTQADNAADALAQFPNGDKRLQAAQAQLKQLRAESHAASARVDLDTAQSMLAEAQRQLSEGSSGWNLKLQAAEGKLLQAKKDIGSAEESAAATRDLGYGFLGLVLLGLIGFPLFRRRAVGKVRDEVEESLKPWDEKFAKMDDAAIDNVDKWLLDNSKAGWQGKTAELVGQVKQEAGTADLRRKAMRGIYEKMTSLARPSFFSKNLPRWYYNRVSTKNFDEVKNLLSSEQVSVELEERRQDWRADLYGPIDNFKPVKKTFSELVDSHNEHARKAVELRDQVEKARADAATLLKDVQGDVSAAQAAQASLKNADGLFQAGALFDKALPQASTLLEAAKGLKDFDPVGALAAGGSEAKRIASEAKALSEALTAARSGALVQANAAAAQLRAASLKDQWISAEESRLSAESDAMASDVTSGSIAGRTQALTQALDAIAKNAADAIAGLKALIEQNQRAVTFKTSIGDARGRLSQLTGLAADKLLVEKDANPDDKVSNAVESGKAVEKALNEGKLAEAKTAFDAMKQSLDNAASMIDVALKTAEGYQKSFAERGAETERLKTLVGERQAVLDSIRKDFAKSVLSLGAGDASHPGANDTIDDNIEEATTALDAAAAKTQRSQTAFKAGKLLEAADLLTQAHAHQEIAQNRLDEISEKRQRLDKQVSANAAGFKALKDRGTALESVFKDNRAMKLVEDQKTGERTVAQGTILEMENAESRFDDVQKLIDAKKGDPFVAAKSIAEVNAALDRVELSFKNDVDAFDSFRHAADAAANQMSQAFSELEKARGARNGNGDTSLIRGAARELAQLQESAKAVSIAVTDAHLDWPAWEREANRIVTEAAHQKALLKDELAHANEATQAINDAAAQVAAATNWNGGFGVYIPGSPGIEQLNAARQALSNGDYQGAARFAAAASQAAVDAVAAAQAEVNRRRRAQEEAEAERQRQIEQERQARQAEEERRRSRSSDGGVSWNKGSGRSSGGDGGNWGNPSSGADQSSFGTSTPPSSGADSSSF